MYSLPNFVRVVKSSRMRWVGHVARMGEGKGVHRVLVGKPEGKRPMGRPRHRWEDNIKMDFEEVGGSCGDWMELAQDRDRWWVLVSTVRNLRVPKMWGISWLAAEPVSFSRRTLLHGVSKYTSINLCNFLHVSCSVSERQVCRLHAIQTCQRSSRTMTVSTEQGRLCHSLCRYSWAG